MGGATHERADPHNARVRAALGELADLSYVKTDTVPWNANVWAYHRRSWVIPTVTDGKDLDTVETVLAALPGVVEVQRRGDMVERPHVRVIWRD
jgi:hypothetical protein